MLSKRLAAAAAAVAAGVGLAVLQVTPAFAINRVDCPPGPSSFLELESPATTCWANAGDIDVGLYGVAIVRTGNNDVDLTFDNGQTVFYARNGEYPFLPRNTVTHIHIR